MCEDLDIYLCKLHGKKYGIFEGLESQHGMKRYSFCGRMVSFTEKSLSIGSTDMGPVTIINLEDDITDEFGIVYQSDSELSIYLASVLSTCQLNSIQHLIAIATIVMTISFTGEFTIVGDNFVPIYHPLEHYKGHVTVHPLTFSQS